MLRAMTLDVTVKTVEPTPTAVVVAETTWVQLPTMWEPMLNQVWSFLRGDAPDGLYEHGHTHTGPITTIGHTHQAVCEWSKANGYRLAGPRWEIYGDPDPSSGDFDVDVFWSLMAK